MKYITEYVNILDPDVKKLLETLGLERYYQHFVEAEIDFFSFQRLTEENLCEMKIPIGPRIKISEEIKRINGR